MFQQLAKPLGPDTTHHRRTTWPRNGTPLREPEQENWHSASPTTPPGQQATHQPTV